ncbi:rod shape-determining protein MreC [Synergistaceae bacterium OttesenSCG-928-D05]|nr:rod shape-determining protein MreC [Synergistaceae bacterium OttesenSCG-928-D05]
MALWDKEQKPWLHGAITVLLGFFILWIMILTPRLHFFLVDGVNTLLYYPEKPSMQLRNVVKYSSNWVLERATLNERVDQLELKNQALLEALQRAQVPVPEPKETFTPAQVTLRYAEAWWREIRVDKGARHGVVEGAAVTSDGHLAGRVSRVGDNYCWVELITSASFLMASAVDETRDLGVVNGDDMGNLQLLFIPEDRELKRGMTVSTSLMSELIPPGIPIGSILATEGTKDGFLQIRLSAGAHLTQLYSVEIFTGRRVQ